MCTSVPGPNIQTGKPVLRLSFLRSATALPYASSTARKASHEVDAAYINDPDEDILADPVNRRGRPAPDGNTATVEGSVAILSRLWRSHGPNLRIRGAQCLTELDGLDRRIVIELL